MYVKQKRHTYPIQSEEFKLMTEQQSLQWDADRIMEQLIMQESRHMQMGALVSYQLRYPDMTIRDFFAMASKELEEQEEELGYYE